MAAPRGLAPLIDGSRDPAGGTPDAVSLVMRQLHILLADDDREMRSWIRAVLRPVTDDVTEVATGWELLHALAHEGPFDLVISDVRMPAPNGLTVVTMARTAGLATPFLVITAFPDDVLRHALEQVPDARLLEKPFAGRALVEAVAALRA